MSADLICRLQERVRSEPTVDFAVFPPIRPRPPVTERALANAEVQLGFPLPLLVRALYTQVANGGYGPGYGVIQLDGGPYTLVGSRKQMNEESADSPGGQWWPERLVEFVNWGCHYFSGIDCSRPSCPVFFYDNDRMVGDDVTLYIADHTVTLARAWAALVPLNQQHRQVRVLAERLSAAHLLKPLANALRAAGYATALVGKWHNGSEYPYQPNARGFDEYYGFTSGHWGDHFAPPLDHNYSRGAGNRSGRGVVLTLLK